MSQVIPESRVYIHKNCGEATEVDGGHFRSMAAPFPGMIQTICSSCGRAFPVEEFHWEDTGEGLADYYKRHQAKVAGFVRMICSRQFGLALLLAGFLGGIGLGVMSWWTLGTFWAICIGIGGCLGGSVAALLVWEAISKRALARSLNIEDVRLLK